MLSNIFSEPVYPTSYFSNEIWVNCPKCKGLGKVESKIGQYIVPVPIKPESSFRCLDCNIRIEKNWEDHEFWLYQGYSARKCSKCQEMVTFISKPTHKLFTIKELECKNCHTNSNFKISWFRYRPNSPFDPYFRYELYLVTYFKNEVLWFYNLDHLNYIEKYIFSNLREDNQRYKYSLISNLPKFMILSKNRNNLLNKMKKLRTNSDIRIGNNL